MRGLATGREEDALRDIRGVTVDDEAAALGTGMESTYIALEATLDFCAIETYLTLDVVASRFEGIERRVVGWIDHAQGDITREMGSVGYDRDAAVDGGRLDGCASYLEAAANLDLVHSQAAR